MTPKTSSDSSHSRDVKEKAKKIPFTLRLEEDLLERLQIISQNASKAAAARNYLNLSYYLIAKQDLTIESPDGMQQMMITKKMIREWFKNLNDSEKIELGDELGVNFNTNCSIQQINSVPDKIKYLQSIGWFNVKLLQGLNHTKEKVIFYGIPGFNWPLNLLHAFLHRILHNQKIPSEWTIENHADMLAMEEKELKNAKKRRNDPVFKKYPTIIEDFIQKIGGHKENFDENCPFYKFDTLVVQ